MFPGFFIFPKIIPRMTELIDFECICLRFFQNLFFFFNFNFFLNILNIQQVYFSLLKATQ